MSNINSQAPDHNKNIMSRSLTLSAGTLTSRVLGFVRDVILANVLGTGFWADAFFVAQRIPNMFRDALGEGAANAVVIPVVAKYRQNVSQHQWVDLINTAMLWGAVILGGLTIVGLIAVPWIVHGMAPGFAGDEAKVALTIELTRIMFPYLVLIALTAFQMGILQVLNRYAVPAFGPCLLNIFVIAAAGCASWLGWPLVQTLAWGVLLGGVAQFVVQMFALRSAGVRWMAPQNWFHPSVKQMGKLLVPRLWGSMVYQMNIVADTLCASLSAIVGSGGVAAIYYATRLIQFPLGIFGVAMAGASLPAMSRQAGAQDYDLLKKTIADAVNNLLFVFLPSTVLCVCAAKPLVSGIFGRGAFDAHSIDVTVEALIFFSLGLCAYGTSKVVLGAFYALEDTKTPVRIATICLVINVVLNVMLMGPLKIGGIALASAISGWANIILLVFYLTERIGFPLQGIDVFLRKIAMPLIVMGIAVIAMNWLLPWSDLLKLTAIFLGGITVYVACAIMVGVPQMEHYVAMIKQVGRGRKG